jgi:hypothetical protein
MAGDLIKTEQNFGGPREFRKLVLAWTSDGSGVVAYLYTPTLWGVLGCVVFAPGAGDVQPTDAYDVQLLDEHGIDILAGQGANLSNSAASRVCPGVPCKDGTTTGVVPVMLGNRLQLVIGGAGVTKQGTIELYLRGWG